MATKLFRHRCGRPSVRAGVALLVGALGCAAPFQRRLPDVAIAPSRMVVLPVIVKEFDLDFNGDRQMDAETNDAARDNVAAAVGDQTKARGAHLFVPKAFDGHDPLVRQLYADLWRWMENASVEIAAQKAGRRDFGRHSVGDWRFHRDLAPLGDALQADTALTLLIRETKDHGNWRGISAACVVSLRDSRMIWCHDEDDPWGNLKDPAVAQAAVRDLLTGLDAPAASAPAK
jgi:hypothetical protein